MKRISIVLLFLAVVAVLSCKNKADVVEPGGDGKTAEIKPGTLKRNGPGYSWEFITPNQYDPNEYYDTGSRRIYYAKGSQGYTRACTLRVTKTGNTTPSSIAFSIYDRDATCLSLSSGSSATGTFSYDVWSERMQGQRTISDWKGYTWVLPASELNSAPIGSVYEFVFTLILPQEPIDCPEGQVYARMKLPSDISSVGYFWDGDVFFLTQNASM